MSGKVSPLHVLVGGGTGFVGQEVIRQLTARGHRVTLLSRKAKHQPGQHACVTWADLSNRGLGPYGVDVIVNLSGQNILNPASRWTEAFKREVIESRVDTTLFLAQVITRETLHRPSVFIATSAVGIYPPRMQVPYDETTPLHPPPSTNGPNFPISLVHQWEQAAKLPADFAHSIRCSTFIPGSNTLTFTPPSPESEAPPPTSSGSSVQDERNNTRCVIIRVGVVLGRDGGALASMRPPFLLGLGGPIGSGLQFFPWIHIRDLGGLYVHAIESPQVSGVLNGVAPEIVTNGQFAKALGRALHRPAFIPMPDFAVNLIFGKERSTLLLDGQKVIPRRTLDSGFHYAFPTLDAALHDLSN